MITFKLAEYPTLALVSKGLSENVVVVHLAAAEGKIYVQSHKRCGC